MNALALAAISMVSNLLRLNSTAENIANATTPAYQRWIPVSRSYVDQASAVSASSPSVLGMDIPAATAAAMPTSEAVRDARPGPIRATGNPLDLALDEGLFLEVVTPAGTAYTRQGNLRLDARGRLVTEAGFAVMGISGEIVLTGPAPVIDATGAIFEAGKQVGQIRLAKFENPRALAAVGSNLFTAGSGVAPRLDSHGRVRQGFLESSNVNPVVEMVRLMETVRHFETGQRVVQAYDEMLEKSIRRLGEF